MIGFARCAREWYRHAQLPPAAKQAARSDRAGVRFPDARPERIMHEAVGWLSRAQDCSASRDGGVARHYSLLNGWAPSYPETTGYIIPTLLSYAQKRGDSDAIARVRRMLDWLVSIQYPEGGFQGGVIGQTPRVPVIFNTGQILIGLCAGAQLDPCYREAMIKAADWLVASQDDDGCWRKHASPFAKPGPKTYETHVSLALFRAAVLAPKRFYAEAAFKQVDWALKYQRSNGWLENCCLTDPSAPLTHTIGYALRGIIEAYLHSQHDGYLHAACRTADGLVSALRPDGRLPGRLDSSWQTMVDWVCLTGASQIAESWLLLHKITGRMEYRRAALLANEFGRGTITVDGPPEIRGGVKGSFPADGQYGQWQFLSWACKFTIDANCAELALDE